MTCPDLLALFGARYRISREADGATWRAWPESEHPWLLEIRSRHGVVSPWGDGLLQCATDRPRTAARLLALPFIVARRGGTNDRGELVVRFPVEAADEVFRIIRPRRRRNVTEAERVRLVARLRRVRAQGAPESPCSGALAGPDFDDRGPDHTKARAGGRSSILGLPTDGNGERGTNR